MRINTNIASLTAQEAGLNTGLNMRNSLEKLSTGLAINSAGDDAAGLATADKMRTQTSSLRQAVENGNSGIALIKMADRAFDQQTKLLDTVKAKLIQAATVTSSQEAQLAIANDIDHLLTQIDFIAKEVNYNGTFLLQASATSKGASGILKFQLGEFTNSTMEIAGLTANVAGFSLTALQTASTDPAGLTGAVQATNADHARSYFQAVDDAIDLVNRNRSNFGAVQNEIESSVRTLNSTVTSLAAAESVIRDVDFAAESANFNKHKILSQTGTYAISQASAIQQNVLKLLN